MEKFVLTITTHPLWGNVIQALLVEHDDDGKYVIIEQMNSKSSFFKKLSEKEKYCVQLVEAYSEKALMKAYSKEKSIVDFHKKIAASTIDTYIRPFIEKKQYEVIKIAIEQNIAIYNRPNNSVRTFYDDTNLISVEKTSPKAHFNFNRDENGLQYYISIKLDNNELNLINKDCVVICNEPAIVLIDKNLFAFDDIDAKKLIPFFSKDFINVPPASEKIYIEKFVTLCVKKYEVSTKGSISVQNIRPQQQALLTFENNLYQIPVLHLNFSYDNKLYSINYSNKKHTTVDFNDKDVVVNWFVRDKDWEQSMINQLLSSRLRVDKYNDIVLADNEKYNTLVEWLTDNEALRKAYNFKQQLGEIKYYLGEIKLQLDLKEQQDWFDIHIEAHFGEFSIPFVRFKKHVLNNIHEYILPNGEIAILPDIWFEKYLDFFQFGQEQNQHIRLKRQHYALINKIGFDEKTVNSFNFDTIQPIAKPENLKAELRQYQLTGLSWLVNLYQQNFGGCLADDMGLGKTIQTIGLLQHIHNKRASVERKKQIDNSIPQQQLSLFDDMQDVHEPSLIVVPNSLIHNWLKEIKRFAPTLKTYSYTGAKRLKSKEIFNIFNHYDVVITTYGTVRNDIEILCSGHFHHLILDESQYVKNPDSQTFKCIKRLNTDYKLALTGTPIENSLNDLWAQFDILNEGMLGSFLSFKNRYVNPINKDHKEREQALLNLIRPFILRRTKNDVAPELPELHEKIVYCDMSESQRKSYDSEKNKLRNSIIGITNEEYSKKISYLALQGLTKLRLLANHPKFVDTDYTESSGKFEQVIMYMESLRSEGHKVLVFSSFVKQLRCYADYYDQQQWEYAWLTGSTPTDERQQQIERFSNNEDVGCFFVSIKAGGVGLNLTMADYVFILDPWWNPAVENQAVSRAHRIGQKKNVIVFRFISSDTIEEKIQQLQIKKSKLADTFVVSNNLVISDKEELIQLLN